MHCTLVILQMSRRASNGSHIDRTIFRSIPPQKKYSTEFTRSVAYLWMLALFSKQCMFSIASLTTSDLTVKGFLDYRATAWAVCILICIPLSLRVVKLRTQSFQISNIFTMVEKVERETQEWVHAVGSWGIHLNNVKSLMGCFLAESISLSCEEDCNGHGTCENGECRCSEGYTGRLCDESKYFEEMQRKD